MNPDDVDDVDILFARLERAVPPANLRARVLAGARERSRRRHLLGYGLLAAAIALAVALSFSIGQQLRASGALALLAFLVDAELLAAAPAEVALALLELIPWHLVVLVGGALAMVLFAMRLALSPSIRLEPRTARS